MDELQELYRQVILDHNRNPRNFGELADATRVVAGVNPLCGDKMTLYVKLGGGNEIFPWVFNLADVMLLTGMGLLMIHINRIEKHKKAVAETQQADTSKSVTQEKPAASTSSSSDSR